MEQKRTLNRTDKSQPPAHEDGGRGLKVIVCV